MKQQKKTTNYLHIPVTPNDFVDGKIACIDSKYQIEMHYFTRFGDIAPIHHL